jgi:hypothetical protein
MRQFHAHCKSPGGLLATVVNLEGSAVEGGSEVESGAFVDAMVIPGTLQQACAPATISGFLTALLTAEFLEGP